jgi:ATP-dependent RNA helicase RhlE
VDHLSQKTAKLDEIEILVLDEADRMLDMGFKPQLTRILQRVPKIRQTMLFSATMGPEVAEFAREALRDPVRVEVARSGTTAERAVQHVFLATQEEKLPLLLALLEADDLSTLVFTRTKRRADKVWKVVAAAGHKVARIHADRSQGQRRMALDGFKDGTYRVLVATDIAARGIDVAEIGHVVNFDLPHVAEDYVHRVGRTARAAASGRASSFAAPEEKDLLRGIERLTRVDLPRAEVPRESAAFTAELERSRTARSSSGPRQANGARHGRPHRSGGGGGHGGGRSGGHGGHARPASSGGGGHAGAGHSGGGHGSGGHAPSGGSGKPKLVGSWGGKRRR